MKITECKYTTCGQDWIRIAFDTKSVCNKSICCKCCKKQGLRPLECEMAQLELKRLGLGKQLNANDVKGLLLERAVSTALYALRISHNHNPFDNTYPCYQNKRPDITIPRIDTVIECKNLSKRQIDVRLSKEWLEENVTRRRYSLCYRRKIVLFSFRPKKSLCEHLCMHSWKVYSLGEQVLNPRQERKVIGKLKKRFYWLTKEYSKTRKPTTKQQTRLKLLEIQGVIYS